MSYRPALSIRILITAIGCLVVSSQLGTFASVSAAADAEWRMLAGPFDPQPSWEPRAIHDQIRHRMLIVDGLKPDVLWTLTLPISGTPQWGRLRVAGPTPPPRRNASAVYDAKRDQVVLFGGTTDRHSCNDVWTLSMGDAPQWSELRPVDDLPTPRESPSAIFDPIRDCMIVFGGYCQDSSLSLGDAWELRLADGPRWVPIAGTGPSPQPGDAGAAVYDPAGDRMLVFGSRQAVWALSLSGTPAWDSLHVTTPRPSARFVSVAVLDPVRRRVIIHGGSRATEWGATLSDTWAFQLDDPPAWAPLATSGETLFVMQQAAIYSPERGNLIEFGGSPENVMNAFDELDLGTLAWSRIRPDEPAPFPSRRSGSFLTVDDRTGHLLVFGGSTGGCLGDLWAFDGTGPPEWTQLASGGAIPDCGSIWSWFGYWNFVQDPRRNRLIAIHGDAWFGRTMNRIFARPLDGTADWTELYHEGVEPLGRYATSLVHDPVRDRLLMFGGYILGSRSNDSGEAQDDVWALSLGDTLRWTQLQPRGTPGARDSHTAAFDARRDRMIVFGGESQMAASLGDTRRPLFDTWALSLAGDSLAWSRLSPSAPTSGPAVLDTLRDRLMAWLGDAALWVLPLQGAESWQRLTAAGDVPTTRTDFGWTFDAARDRMLLFGGRLAYYGSAWSQAATADVYELRFADGAAIALQDARCSWNEVSLSWSGARAGEVLSVLRSEDDTTWAVIASIAADGDGRLEFTDLRVVPGRRYGYALGLPGGSQRFAMTWVTIPPAPAFALRGLQPNPAGRQVAVAFTLPDAAPASLQLIDVSGRRVVDRRLEGMGAGPHVVILTEGPRLPPGLYFVRLAHGGRSLVTRGVIVR